MNESYSAAFKNKKKKVRLNDSVFTTSSTSVIGELGEGGEGVCFHNTSSGCVKPVRVMEGGVQSSTLARSYRERGRQ